jgi:drug/metabolite transporter (DMT)-like permease
MTVAETVAPTYPPRERRIGIAAVFLAAVGLSSGSTLVKLAGAPGSVVGFWRLAFGAGIWAIINMASNTPMPWSVVRRVVPAGLLFGTNILLFFNAAKATRVANVEFIAALTPVLTVPLAYLVLHENVRWRPMLLGIPALAGVALIVFNGPPTGEQSLRGDLLALGAVVSWSFYLLATKRVRREVSTNQFMGTLSAVAALVVLPFAVATGEITDLTAKGWAMCVLLAIVTGTVSHGLIVWAQRHVELSIISVVQLAQPAMAAVWAWLLLDETVTSLQVVGMAIVLASLCLFTIMNARR